MRPRATAPTGNGQATEQAAERPAVTGRHHPEDLPRNAGRMFEETFDFCALADS
jgi:hypothetical protein